MAEPAQHPSFREAFLFWVKLGFINFGGPTGQIAIMHRELVERRRWISEERFLHALNYCMVLPGPEAHQLAIYIGWLLHRTVGGLAAGFFFVGPSIVILLGLSWAYAALGHVPAIAGIFAGLKPVVLAVVVFAAVRIGRRALQTPLAFALAAIAFAALAFLRAPFPLVVLGAGAVGLAAGRLWPHALKAPAGHGPKAGAAVLHDDSPIPDHATPSVRRAATVLAVGAALLIVPLAAFYVYPGPARVFLDASVFFLIAAFVTFGGAYAVLSYISQHAVAAGWLTGPQMLDGLGLAETTPGPLIMVNAFVGFMAGWNLAGPVPPAVAGTVGLLIAVWFTFVPSFVFIFFGAPWVEKVRRNRTLSTGLAAITAAVVGVIASLAVYFGAAVLFPAGAIAWFPLVLAVGALVALFLGADVIPVVAAGAVIGLLSAFSPW